MSHVYVIASEGGMCKIGRANDPEKRLRSISTGHPHKLTIAKVYHVGDQANDVEQMAHRALAEDRMNGEWFNVSIDTACEAVEAAIDPDRPSYGKPILSSEMEAILYRAVGMAQGVQHQLLGAIADGVAPDLFRLRIANALRRAADLLAPQTGPGPDDDL